MKNKLCLLSGGMDSTVLLHSFKETVGLAVTFDYGSKHAAREIECAIRTCKELDIPHIIIPLDFINQYFESSLLKSGNEIPDGHYAAENMKSTVVPFRNGIMISICVGLAESRGLTQVLIASHAGDHFIYPDCRPAFTQAISAAAIQGTNNNVGIWAPFEGITKTDIASIGRDKGVNFKDTWSCYKGGEVHCGTCGTCVERKEAFRDAGIEDPTIYLQ